MSLLLCLHRNCYTWRETTILPQSLLSGVWLQQPNVCPDSHGPSGLSGQSQVPLLRDPPAPLTLEVSEIVFMRLSSGLRMPSPSGCG